MWLKRWMFTVFLLVNLAPITYAGDTCFYSATVFVVGEELTYRVGYKWYALKFNAGVIKFKVEPAYVMNTDAYHFSAIGKTFKSYDWFFKVRDVYDSFVDTSTLMPIDFVRNIDENGYLIYEHIKFQQSKNTASVMKDKDTRWHKFKIPYCTQDVLSVIYWARGLDFSNFDMYDTVPVNIFIDKEVYPVYIKYLGKETIKTKFGKMRCVVFEPLLIAGTIFDADSKMKVWASDDKNHLPVLIESPILVGKLRAYIETYKNLKYPLTSLKKK